MPAAHPSKHGISILRFDLQIWVTWKSDKREWTQQQQNKSGINYITIHARKVKNEFVTAAAVSRLFMHASLLPRILDKILLIHDVFAYSNWRLWCIGIVIEHSRWRLFWLPMISTWSPSRNSESWNSGLLLLIETILQKAYQRFYCWKEKSLILLLFLRLLFVPLVTVWIVARCCYLLGCWLVTSWCCCSVVVAVLLV